MDDYTLQEIVKKRGWGYVLHAVNCREELLEALCNLAAVNNNGILDWTIGYLMAKGEYAPAEELRQKTNVARLAIAKAEQS